MKIFVEKIYLKEVEYQCAQGLDAGRRAVEAIQANSRPDIIISFIDDIVDHASRVALLLWPIPGRKARNEDDKAANDRRTQRGEHLRASIGVDDNHVTKNRKLRDHLHHFDERIDEITLGDRIFFIDVNIGQKNTFMFDGVPPKTMRHFDPSTGIYSFQEDDFNIADILDGIQDIYVKAQKRSALLD